MRLILNDRSLSILRAASDETKERALYLIYAFVIEGKAPDMTVEPEAVQYTAGLLHDEICKAQKRSEANHRYHLGLSDKTSDKTTDKIKEEKERNERENSSPRTPYYKEKDNKEKEEKRATPTDKTSDKTESAESKAAQQFRADAFERFWSVYPKRKGKFDANRAFDTLLKNTPKSKLQELVNTIYDAVCASAQSYDWVKEDGKYIPYPATYIRQHRWEDEQTGGVSGAVSQSKINELAERLTA